MFAVFVLLLIAAIISTIASAIGKLPLWIAVAFLGSALAKKMTEDFGSYEAWEKDFKTTGSMRGIGWTVLYQDSVAGKLYNFWINEHDVSHPAGCNPILILDVFEHAFMIDYGLKRADYVEAFFKNIDWKSLEGRVK